ncbi:MAG TPA: glycosyltransferase family 4 protein [Tepidisphaeraceae bacterium]|jgi:glycosyltransferase involved in cell wall biosynthesis
MNVAARPRIALVSGDFPPTLSGIGDYTEKLALALHARGADVTVVTSSGTPAATRAYPFDVRREMPAWGFADRHRLLDLLRDYDVAHIQYPSGAYGRGLMINALPHLIARHCPATRSLVTIHDFRVMRWRWRARVAPMLWGIDGLIHVDPKDGPWLQSWLPFRRVPTQVIPIAANAEPVACGAGDRARWRRELGFAEDEVVVAFFGVLYPHKGLPELHEAIEALQSRGRQVRLLVLGDFDRQAEWRAGIEQQLRRPGVVWVQGAPLERVSECLHAADLAALPFHSGASTNRGSLLATLAHGLPTVTTNGPCTPPELSSIFDLSLVPIQSAAKLMAGIEELLDRPDVAARMRANALAAMAKMSWPAVAESTLAFYDRLLGKAHAQKDAA